VASAPQLRIVVPACNEAKRLEPTLREYCAVFDGAANVIVVANGCTDGTVALVERLKPSFPNLEYLEIRARIGKGGAVRAALAPAREPFIGFVDADGSTSAVEYARMYGLLKDGPADAIICSRWLPGATVSPKQPLLRRLASRCFNLAARLLFGLRFSDTQCGAKIFRRQALGEIESSLELAGFAFDVEVLWRLQRRGFRIQETPAAWSDRAGTKIDLIHGAWSMLCGLLRLRIRDSWIWRVPFADWLGRSSSVPVNSGRRILLTGADEEHSPSGKSQVNAFVGALRKEGLTVIDSKMELGTSRVAALLRYIFASHRDYDALVEVASRKPRWIAALSTKPSMVIQVHPYKKPASVYRFYRRSILASFARMTPEEAASYVALTVSVQKQYPAVFVNGKVMPRHEKRTFLVVAPQGLGDSLEATPLIAGLRRNDPASRIDVAVLRSSAHELFSNLPEFVDEVIYLPYWDRGKTAFVAELLKQRRGRRYDAVFVAYPAARWEYRFLARAFRSRRTYIHRYWQADPDRFLGRRETLVEVRPTHNVLRNMDLLSAAQIYAERPIGYTVPAAWKDDEGREARRVILHIGTIAHDGLESRRWPLEKFARVATVLSNAGCDVRAVMGPSEVTETLKLQVMEPRVGMIQGSLAEVARELSRASLTIANDSGIAHLSVGVGTPTISLFGPTPLEHAPFGPESHPLRPSMCPPCFDVRRLNTNCARDIGFACIRRELSPELVISAALTLLETSPASPSVA
jgi:dolichol-phosphate mannosyltransferase